MATCVLTLYKNTKLENSKNDIVEDIETYLSGLESFVVDSSFQYQRFELDKTIKVNMSQDYQTKSDSFNKYNYCKLSTVVDDVPVNYYYFITKTSQIAQKTIELTLRMDTLNTFHFTDGEVSNNSYTLDEKTLIKREHKDRLKRVSVKTTITNIDSGTTAVLDDLKNDNEFDNVLLGAREKVVLINDEGILRTYLNTISQSNFPLNFTYTLAGGAYILKSDYNKSTQAETLTQYSDIVRLEITLTIRFNMRETYLLKFYNQDNEIVLQINVGAIRIANLVEDIETLYTLVIPRNGSTIQSGPNSISWSDFIDNFYNTEKTALVSRRPYKRIVDKFSEGLGTTLFKREDETLYDGDEQKHWMLAYRNDEETATTVNMLLYPEETMNITTQTSAIEDVTPEEIPNKANQEEWVKFLHYGDYDVDNYIEVNGTQYKVVPLSTTPSSTEAHGILLRKQNSNDIVFKDVYRLVISSGSESYTSIAQEVSLVKVHGWGNAKIYTSYYTNRPASGSYWQDYWVGSKANITSGTVDSWKDVKLYDTKLIKAFVFPYCPSQYFHGRMNVSAIPDSYTYLPTPVKAISLRSANNNDFSYELDFGDVNPQSVLIMDNIYTGDGYVTSDTLTIGKQKDREVAWESKLYNSDYYQPKFVYDSFSYTFNLEDVDIDNWLNAFSNPNYFSVNYTVSTNIVSKFAFQFLQYVTERSTQDYESVLCIERNNEKALYNSEYLNYIKNGGYNYDTKKANSQNAINGITTALSIVGAVASFAAAPYTGGSSAALGAGLVAGGVGLATSAASGIARGIYTAQEQDKAISQKMLQAQMQGNTVQGNEDLDILTVITENKAKLVVYRLSDIMRDAMWDLFHYCGYATYEQKVPETDTRLYFNFIQADIIYDKYNFNDDVADDIKNRWSQGVTFFHKVDGGYDLDQEYENFEVSLL